MQSKMTDERINELYEIVAGELSKDGIKNWILAYEGPSLEKQEHTGIGHFGSKETPAWKHLALATSVKSHCESWLEINRMKEFNSQCLKDEE